MSSAIDEKLKPKQIDGILEVSTSSQYEEVVLAMKSGLYKGLTFGSKLSENFKVKVIKQMPEDFMWYVEREEYKKNPNSIRKILNAMPAPKRGISINVEESELDIRKIDNSIRDDNLLRLPRIWGDKAQEKIAGKWLDPNPKNRTIISIPVPLTPELKENKGLIVEKKPNSVPSVIYLIEESIKTILRQLKRLVTDLQAQRVGKLQEAKDLRLDMSSANNRYENHQLKKQADTLKQHLEKIRACIAGLEAVYTEIDSQRSHARIVINRGLSLLNPQYQWPLNASEESQLLELLQIVLAEAKKVPTVAKTDFFKHNNSSDRALSQLESTDEMSEELPPLISDYDSGSDSDKTEPYYY